jgi:hypothetical protein
LDEGIFKVREGEDEYFHRNRSLSEMFLTGER